MKIALTFAVFFFISMRVSRRSQRKDRGAGGFRAKSSKYFLGPGISFFRELFLVPVSREGGALRAPPFSISAPHSKIKNQNEACLAQVESRSPATPSTCATRSPLSRHGINQSINQSIIESNIQPINQSKRSRLKGITAQKSPFLPLSEDQPLM